MAYGESCPCSDEYETARQAASGTRLYSLGGRRGGIANAGTERCAQLLSIAEECWAKPPYASAHAGSRSNFTNRALLTCEDLKAKLREIPLLPQPTILLGLPILLQALAELRKKPSAGGRRGRGTKS